VKFPFFPSLRTRRRGQALLRELMAGRAGARETFERVLRLDPDSFASHFGLGTILWEEGSKQEALDHFRQAMRVQPTRFEACLWQAAVNYPANKPLADGYFLLGIRHALRAEIALSHLNDVIGNLPPWMPGVRPGMTHEDYETLALDLQEKTASEPPEVTEELAPYRMIDEVAEEAAGGLSQALIDRVLQQKEITGPLLAGVLRTTGGDEALPDFSWLATASLALLGETGLLGSVPALLEFCANKDAAITVAATWAMHRLRQVHAEQVEEWLRRGACEETELSLPGVAQQLYLVRERPGTDTLLLSLLERSVEAPDSDTGPVAVLVCGALADAPSEEVRRSVRALLRRLRKQVDPVELGWCLSLLDKESRMEPVWADPEWLDLTVGEICSEGALEGLRGDLEADVVDEDEWQDEEPPPPPEHTRPKPGRNEPCWCGSGKKYKKCHLAEDEASRPKESAAAAESESVWLRLMDWSLKRRSKMETAAAMEAYFGDKEHEVTIDETPNLMDWLLLDYQPPSLGCSSAEAFLNRSPGLRPEERTEIEPWLRSYSTFYEVQEVKPGQGLEVLDLLSQTQVFLRDVSASRALIKWDVFIGRAAEIDGAWFLRGTVLTIPREQSPALIAWVKRQQVESGLDWETFLKAYNPRIRRELYDQGQRARENVRLTNTAGEPFKLSTATYELEEPESVNPILASVPEFDEDEEGFDWLERTPDGNKEPNHILGRIHLRGRGLVLETNSVERLSRGKRLLEDLLPGRLRHLRDHFEDAKDLMSRAGRNRPRRSRDEIPPEVQAQVVGQYLDQHYASWPDRPLPALGGLTPRAALQNPSGREDVERLLRYFEHSAELERKEGRPAYDFSRLRRALGLL
jgi:hypothetical protein